MKTLVIYSSKTGFTKNYAEWISEELPSDCFALEDFDENKFAEYDTIIYGGGLYASGINGIKKIKKNMNQLKNKNLIVYMTGASPSKTCDIREVINYNFSEEDQKFMEFFYIRGGFDFERLKLIDKCLMRLMQFKIKRNMKKRELTGDEKGMLNAFETAVDFTSKNKTENLLEYVCSLDKRS